MKNLNLMQKRILLVGFGIIVLTGLFPSWACGAKTNLPPAPPKQQTQEVARAQANKLAADQGLDMREGSPDYKDFWTFAKHAPEGVPFEDQVKWAVNNVKAGRPGAPPATLKAGDPAKVRDYWALPTQTGAPPAGGKDPWALPPSASFAPGAALPPLTEEQQASVDRIERMVRKEQAAAVDVEPIVILILVLLAVVCLSFYFMPQLTVWGSQTPKQKEFATALSPLEIGDTEGVSEQERPGPIEKKEAGVKDNNVSQIMIMVMVIGIIFHVGISNFIEAKKFGYSISLLSSVGYTIPMILFSLIFVWPIKRYITNTDNSFDIKNIVIALCIMAALRMITGV